MKDRGSFPLDHYGELLKIGPHESSLTRTPGECQQYMKVYLDCLKKNGSNSTPCRAFNRDYLDCRMNK